MRTPNASCLVCAKPLYRRPSERARFAACMAHRAEAQKIAGITPAQLDGLSWGRVKGTNRRNGRPDGKATRAKKSKTIRAFYAAHPEKAIERGAKIRGPLNAHWKGGSSKFNTSIRQMTEHRRWMDAVKARDDGKCVRCGSGGDLESHHKVELAELILRHGIRTRDQARACAELWDLDNGETLCRPCHYAHHGRRLPA